MKFVRSITTAPVSLKFRLFAGRNPILLAFALAMSVGVVQSRAQEVVPEVYHDLSPPLRDIHPDPVRLGAQHEARRHGLTPNGSGLSQPVTFGEDDPTLQSSPITLGSPTPGITFEGVGAGFTGPSGSFVVQSAPPDPNGTVGPNHYVETVNASFAVFTKSGTPILGPIAINQIWSGFGGGCQNNNDGDPTVVYDKIADRWVIQQFSVSTTPYLQCVAVSATNDPTGAYHRYSFQFTDFPDYPKLGVWPDAYYLTVNAFIGGVTFNGSRVCALNRTAMLAGNTASLVCFSTSNSFGSLLPSDLDGSTLPPAGAPNYMLALDTNSTLVSWKFHTDFVTPANSSFTGPTSIPVTSYNPACNGGTCIPQSGTTQKLDSLADRLMYRLAYRNFGTHESLVVNHSVTAGSVPSGVRWYELRIAGGTPTIFQQGTYAPDATSRWMGSIAMDSQGGIAVGYSVSSSSTFPGIHYTGRLAGDAAGVMTQGENTIINGAGSQSGNNLSRWGDYSSMSVDPTDDCTFWYTTEYLKNTGSFNWSTRVGTFKLPGCAAPVGDFSLAATPSSQTVQQGNGTTFTATETPSGGFTGSVTLTVSGLPTGATGSFSPNPTTSTSTLTVATSSTTPAGSYPLTITGTSGSLVHTANVTLTVTAAPNFSLAASPSSVSVAQGGNGTSTVTVTPIAGFAGTVALSASGLPSGVTASFNPASTTSTSTLTLTASSTAAVGPATVTITGTSGTLTHTTTVTLTVTAVNSAPTLTSVTPNSGAQGAAVNVTLAGTNFIAGATVAVTGTGVTVSNVTVVSGTQITATLTIAAGATVGSRSVSVSTTAGTSGTVPFTVNTASTLPTLTSVAPSSGALGTSVNVTLTGTNFTSGSQVRLQGVGLKQTNIVVVSPTQITATYTISSSAALGAHNTWVVTSAGSSNMLTFTVTATGNGPTLTSVTPNTGVQGTAVNVTLTGTNFVSGATVAATGTGVTASNVTVVSGTQITATLNIAANAGVGQDNLSVTTSGGTSGSVPFSVTAAAVVPTLTSISPSTGAQGASVPVTLTGTGFVAPMTINTGSGITVSNVSVVSSTQATATFNIAGNAATGPSNVSVTTTGGTSGNVSFNVTAAAVVPTLTSISPSTGTQGASVPVTLTGTGFVAPMTINTGSGITVSNVSVVSSTQATATFNIAGNAATGSSNVSVTTTGGTSGTVSFNVTAAVVVPTLTSISPSSGSQGSSFSVTLTGSGFVAPLTVNSGSGITVSNVSVVSSTQATATFNIAANAAAGASNVSVTTTGGTSGNVSFNVTAAAVVPTLTSISPSSGSQGSSFSVTLTGTGFVAPMTINTGSGITVSNVSVVSSTQATATFNVAANAATGPSNVSVTTTGGTSNTVAFTVNAASNLPTLTSVTPSSGALGTSVNVTLTGTNFTSGAWVGLQGAGLKQTNIVVVSPTQITATFTIAPTAATGPHNTKVVTSAGTSNVLTFTVN